eukprot:jgi/Mesen1/10314/ME000079S09741
MRVVTVPVLEDNYSYLLIDDSTGEAAAVDPVEPRKVLAAAKEAGATLTTVLTTHHHWDHAGGNEKMKHEVAGIRVLGGAIDGVQGATEAVDDGTELSLGASVHVRAIHTPCHTKGHISYYVTDKSSGEAPAVFTGDTLFVAGCGRFFEGSPEEMLSSLCTKLAALPPSTRVFCGHEFVAGCGRFFEGSPEEMLSSLCTKLAALPPSTRVFCGHEYTVKNLEFAASVEGENDAVQKKLAWARQQRSAGAPTVPSTIREELEINPFMRVEQPAKATGKSSATDVMAELRRRKNAF